MKKIEPGLLFLLTAVFFAVVAGGQVSMDARMLQGSPFGVISTLVAAFLAAFGAWFLVRQQSENDATIGAVLIGLSGAMIVADLYEGGEMFATVRFFASLLIFGGLGYVLIKNRVVQMPGAWYGGMVVLVVTAMGASILISDFANVSVDAWGYWLSYGAAFYLTIATVGRVRGTQLLLETIVAAATFVALKGIFEFFATRVDVPTHRIFADWNNPNALAGMLVVALPLSIALAVKAESPLRRVLMIVSGGLLLAALVLTQSKGGLLVAPVGVFVFLVTAVAWRGGKRTLWALAPVVAGVLFFGLIQVTTPKSEANGVPLQRLSQADSEQAQSSEYRILLWKGAKELISQSPVGYGVGTYRFVSAKSGLHEQTHLTHQSFLQMAVEGGVLALIGVLALGLIWTLRVFMGAKALSQERNILRAGVFAAVVACVANGFIESNLFYFGSGLLLFVLIAVGLQLASDGSSPESLPKSVRLTIVTLCCAFPLIISAWSMRIESAKTAVMSALQNQDASALASALDNLATTAPSDDEAIYLRAQLSMQTEQEKIELLKLAVEKGPRTKHLRALASAYQKVGNLTEATATLERALFYDPNNLRTLLLKMQIERDTDNTTAAIVTAERLIAVEQMSYLQVRAIPEYVPTETFEARLFLVTQTNVKDDQVQLLQEAVDGYIRYRETTVPKIVQMTNGGLPGFVGDTLEIAREKLTTARDAANQLAQLYREIGDDQSAIEVEALSDRLTLDSTTGT